MKKHIRICAMVMGVYALTALGLVYAEHEEGMRKQHEQRTEKIYAQLNLTDEQKQKLETNKQQNREKMKSIREDMKTSRQALKAELMKPELDMSAITVLQDKLKAAQAQVQDDRLSAILGVRSILTPEQFEKFLTLTRERKKGMK